MMKKKQYKTPETTVVLLNTKVSLLTVSGGSGLAGDIGYGGAGADEEEGD